MNIIIKYIKWHVDYGTQLFIPFYFIKIEWKGNSKELIIPFADFATCNAHGQHPNTCFWFFYIDFKSLKINMKLIIFKMLF